MAERRWAFAHRLAVRFSDCDMYGHVNNAVYFTYFEQCRVAWWHHLGYSISGMPDAGVILVHASCNYRAPSFVSDELDIRLAVTALGNSSVTLDYEIVRAATGELVADGRTVAVAFDYTANTTIPIPPAVRATLTGLLDA